ncbi:MAG: ABC transporter permease [Campylobacteraceae bacterium]
MEYIKTKSNFQQFKSVIFALLIRETKTRFGQRNFGFFWVFAEPLLHVLVLTAVLVFLKNRMMAEISFELFLITGLIPFFLFRNIVKGLMTCIDANRALFAYKPVKPIDTYLTRVILETFIYSVVFIFLIFIFGFWGGFDVSISNPFELMLNFFLLIIMSFSIGILLSMLYDLFPLTKTIVNVFFLPLYFLSAIMYPLWIIPASYLKYLEYNPILQIIELLRRNFFSNYPVTGNINIHYPLFITIVTLFLALFFYRYRRIKLIAKK